MARDFSVKSCSIKLHDLGFARVEQQRAACDEWPRGAVPEDLRAPLRTDIPILLVSGERDPVTPPGGGDAMMEYLSDGVHLRVPGAAHGLDGVVGRECVDRAMVDFIEGGTAAVDASCLAAMRRQPFDTR